ncbi:hypothetical protein EJ05DRAFT_99073 [Pseudovirgaria hyperparasitica]|uniref:Malic acid transport protein n=1 Tax=Pseudovirgaria hyperparasitica TaxID=470096 RepID=A0A6A6W2U2_9PEZI|nr:uncharacterized protein EJ05DRAFT_99073 [Pseudovirgaria hyperparasitica]KAF2755351.1 hypothetical protein EJ05DRAFT_99073 [Pseudovirgaria hyperparasitica]
MTHGYRPRPYLLDVERKPTQYRLYPSVENNPRQPPRIPLVPSVAAAFGQQKSGESTYELLEQSLKPLSRETGTVPNAAYDENAVLGIEKPINKSAKSSVSLKERIRHFTWAWFSLPMSTGGIAIILEMQPHIFPGLFETGLAFYCLTAFLFLSACTVMLARFIMFPSTMKRSISHHREGLFVPTCLLSTASLLTGTRTYIIHLASESTKDELVRTVEILFYSYFICSFLMAISQYTFLFAAHTYPLAKMTPSWMLPMFPIMLTGTVAGVIGPDIEEISRAPLLIVGLAAQGLGFWVAIFMYGQLIGRLMQAGLPGRDHRPEMFISGAPLSFTASALIRMADAVPTATPLSLRGNIVEVSTVKFTSFVQAIFLWLPSFWLVCLAFSLVVLRPPRRFTLGWWAMVFPNTGFVIATINIGEELGSEIVKWMGSGLSGILVCVWIFVFYHNISAYIKKDIMWPGTDEDTDE